MMFVFRTVLMVSGLRQLLVFVFTFFENRWNALAAFRGKLSQEPNNAPHLIVLKLALPARHATEANSVFNDPLELSVFVFLNHRLA